MKDIYLQPPEPRFVFWKWIVFGPLFLLAINYAPSATDIPPIPAFGVLLGVMITKRLAAIRKLNWGTRSLSTIGLSLLISTIASICLVGFCSGWPANELCMPNLIRANIFGNYFFPLIIVLVFALLETLNAIGNSIGYAIKHRNR